MQQQVPRIKAEAIGTEKITLLRATGTGHYFNKHRSYTLPENPVLSNWKLHKGILYQVYTTHIHGLFPHQKKPFTKKTQLKTKEAAEEKKPFIYPYIQELSCRGGTDRKSGN